jgi:hypothetical protein
VVRLSESSFTAFAVVGLLEMPLLPLATTSARWLDVGGVTVMNRECLKIQFTDNAIVPLECWWSRGEP